MRFHHSTRRGRNGLGQYNQHSASNRPTHHSTVSTSRWSQLGYCRDTNIHFNRRLPVEPPADLTQQQRYESTPVDLVHEDLESISGAASDLWPTTERHRPPLWLRSQVTDAMVSKGAAASLFKSPSKRRTDTTSSLLAPLGGQNKQQKRQQDLDERLNKLSLKERSRERSSKRHKAKQLQLDETGYADEQLSQGQPRSPIDMECARQKLIAQVEKHPFWSNKAAKRMQLTGLEERRIYIYELVSFCERRELEWRYEPYRGGLISSAAPFRRAELANRVSLSQPTTPTGRDLLNRSGGASTTLLLPVPRPQTGNQQRHNGALLAASDCDDSFWTGSGRSSLASKRGATGAHSASSPQSNSGSVGQRSPIRRSLSSSTPTGQRHRSLLAGADSQASGGGPLINTSSVLHQSVPSAEFVWSIEAPAQVLPEPFSGCVHVSELPDSSFVKRCHGCQGRGKLKCTSCYGVGYEVCIACSGKGTTKSMSSSSSLGSAARSGGRSYASDYYSARSSCVGGGGGYDYDCGASDGAIGAGSDGRWRSSAGEPGGITGGAGGSAFGGSAWVTESCHFCHGAGQKRCWVCAGKSYNFCLGCSGTGQLRCYLNLNITWLNHRDESILTNSDNIIPRDRLRLCSGPLLADEVSERLKPLARTRMDGATSKPDESNQLHLASKNLLDKHGQTYGQQELLLKQRHKVTQIECHVISYEWKQRRGSFVIYGDERKVYIAKYPFKSFCSIT